MAAKSTKGKKNTKSTAKKTQQKSGQSQNRDEIRGRSSFWDCLQCVSFLSSVILDWVEL